MGALCLNSPAASESSEPPAVEVTAGQTDRETDKETDKETDRETDRETE